MIMTMNKCNCGNLIEEGRASIGLDTCKACAFRQNVPKYRGNLVFNHKTGGEVQVMTAECWDEQKKYYFPQGARSSVKNFSKHTCA